MKRSNTFSLMGLMVLVTLVAVGLAVFLPIVQRERENARRMSCSGHLKQLVIGIHNYHSAYKRMPSLMFGTESNQHRLSGFVALLPFMESQAVWGQISDPFLHQGVRYPAMGPVPNDAAYPAWQYESEPTFGYYMSCPSEPGPDDNGFKPINYAFSVGDQITGLYASKKVGDVRGPFAPQQYLVFRDNTDGLSNTLVLAEITNRIDNRVSGNIAIGLGTTLAQNPSLCNQMRDPNRLFRFAKMAQTDPKGRGYCYADGSGGPGWVTTILPPNGPSCAMESSPLYEGVFSAASRHPGGINVAWADGAVTFITDSIDCGDCTQPSPTGSSTIASPYGLWGALGTRAGNEILEDATNP